MGALRQCVRLRELMGGKNRIGDRGAESLAQAVAKCQKLQFLDLQNNKVMTGRGAKHLSEAWFSSAKPEANLTRKKGLFFLTASRQSQEVKCTHRVCLVRLC